MAISATAVGTNRVLISNLGSTQINADWKNVTYGQFPTGGAGYVFMKVDGQLISAHYSGARVAGINATSAADFVTKMDAIAP